MNSSTHTHNRISTLFAAKARNVLSVYFTAGFPRCNDTTTIICALERAGADMVEIGIPYSDPIADGPTIQESSAQALRNGMTLELLFEQLRDIRSHVELPLVLMGYVNPLLQFGMERFCACCAEIGIDGVIVPDLPVEEYQHSYATLFQQHHLANILLVTPQTPDQRIQDLDRVSEGFLYAVSSAGTTGKVLTIDAEREQYFERLTRLGLQNPVMIGFGIADKTSFDAACRYAQGAIVGSAFITMLAQSISLAEDIKRFIAEMR
jgi:tryptophan synthase alpha chain